jgi:hypothetical protein
MEPRIGELGNTEAQIEIAIARIAPPDFALAPTIKEMENGIDNRDMALSLQ